MTNKEFIINAAKKLNIDKIGFTDGKPLYDIKDYLEYRIKNNLTSEFEEKDIEKRINPKLSMPNCKSIIVIALSYNVDFKPIVDEKFYGKLSKSSWGLDYHRVLKDKMEMLANEISKEIDFNYNSYVDIGPLVDRELAKKSGIGYYGKNCNIINDELGSFIFIGYILTDLEIEPDKPIEDKCGDCKICIKSCPTNALYEPYRINPNRCISYLTQTKKPINEDLKKKMGRSIYGCDICQKVCPKNKKAKKSVHKEFSPTETYIKLDEMFNISNREFKNKYGHMAFSWRGKGIIKRNAEIIYDNILKNRRR